ncbi:hypothetical protein [Flammeovirga sp. SJP92]|uniref:hypothetical protein n=1 Tax=Flammeovirga sp. SJP92 TaxID=1775430 RepID=UPI000797CD39|nr:hypothetical protein [Flammeovirga sp. SJP92]KXX69525.1 hypothetical protein AVL50_15755 [Flammeovirga sp. SJP92]
MIQKYNEVDQKLHQLSQIIAKFNRSFVSQKADDSHTNLQYDVIGERIVGRWITTREDAVIIGLDLHSLSFKVYTKKWKVIFEVPVLGKKQNEIENSFLPFCEEHNFDFDAFKAPLHFDITPYSFLNQKYDSLSTEGISLWKKWRTTAFEMSAQFLEHLQLNSEIRVWPHHFDTGIYIEISDQLGVGFGLAMKDDVCEAPYFYCSAYGLKGLNIDYDTLPPLQKGRWKNLSKWKGAVLEIDVISKEEISLFIKNVNQIYLKYH